MRCPADDKNDDNEDVRTTLADGSFLRVGWIALDLPSTFSVQFDSSEGETSLLEAYGARQDYAKGESVE